jgi:hypothetical protein
MTWLSSWKQAMEYQVLRHPKVNVVGAAYVMYSK